jgi:hypothetical protein
MRSEYSKPEHGNHTAQPCRPAIPPRAFRPCQPTVRLAALFEKQSQLIIPEKGIQYPPVSRFVEKEHPRQRRLLGLLDVFELEERFTFLFRIQEFKANGFPVSCPVLVTQ